MEMVNQTLSAAEEEEWIPVELALVDRMWLPDTEILRLKGFHSLSVLGRLQVCTYVSMNISLHSEITLSMISMFICLFKYV